jgi:cyclic beta-1,2-glucan synthetase
LPALSEIIPGFNFAPIVGIYARVGLPPAIMQKIAAEAIAVVKEPEVIKALAVVGVVVVVAAAAGALVVASRTGAWPVAAPFILLWALSPFFSWRISLPPKLAEAQILSRRETRSLRLIARRTWRFFETFVVEAENFLPPDNFQEDPEPVIAHRTSPTNIGLYLLSTTVAHDFGTIGILDMAKRLEDTLETVSQLRHFRGHLFNWYDTKDTRVLDPAYVSTVDSGNLAGHLIAVAQACHERMQRPLFGPEVLEGIRDALELLRESEEEAERPRRSQTVTEAHLHEATERLEAALEDPPTSLPGWVRRLAELAELAENLLDIARTLANDAETDARSEVVAWATSVQDCVASHARDVDAAHWPSEPRASPLAHRCGRLSPRRE